MCSILGLINVFNSKKEIIKGLKILEKRGLDNNGIYINGNIKFSKRIDDFRKEKIEDGIVLAHNLFSIVENAPQPIKYNNSVLITNCEIYNYKEISEKYNLSVKNDADLILKGLEKKGLKIIDEFQGPYAFCYLKKNILYLRRDLLGIKPLWYTFDKESFAFASEKKALKEMGFEKINSLDPRKELFYNIAKKKLTLKNIPFYKIKKTKTSVDEIYKKLESSILKRVPKGIKLGLLYSAGIDSLIIAKILKDNKIPFTGYFAYSKEITNPKDLIPVENTEKTYHFEIKKIEVNKIDTKKAINHLIDLIESSNPIKIGVALPIYFASKKARKDGCKVIFSGLGADELFAGYHKFKESNNLLKDTINLLYQMHENDLYRDDVVCMNNNIELRLPYLDKELIEESFKLDKLDKIKDGKNKIILRQIGEKINLLKEDFDRKKTAAQYGSGFDKIIEKISKEEKFKNKSDYLEKLSKDTNLNLGCLYSGGKDSNLALHIMHKQNYKISCLMTMITESPDSYMFQKIDDKILYLQSESLEIPFVLQRTKGIKEKELMDLKKLLLKSKLKYSLQGIITGAIKSNYQRDRIQEICTELELKMFAPLWNKTQEKVVDEVLNNNFDAVIVKVAGLGLDESWVGKHLSKEVMYDLNIINKKKGINVAGEGGEYETIVLDAPMFTKKIKIVRSNPIMENEITGYLDILKLELKDKER